MRAFGAVESPTSTGWFMQLKKSNCIFYNADFIMRNEGRHNLNQQVVDISQQLILQIQNHNHSDRRLLTGFINAAFIAWKLSVISAMTMAANPANANIHQCIVIR